MIRTFEINNRRYLGNKFKLIPFIRRVVDEECKDVHSVLDAFSGTGSVSFAFHDKRLLVNDILVTIAECLFHTEIVVYFSQNNNNTILHRILNFVQIYKVLLEKHIILTKIM